MRAPQPTPPLPPVSGAACSALGARGTRLRCSGQERAAPTCGAREQRRACSSEADGSQACPAPQRVGGMLLKGPVLAAREEPPPEREPPWSGLPLPDPPWAVEPPRAPGDRGGPRPHRERDPPRAAQAAPPLCARHTAGGPQPRGPYRGAIATWRRTAAACRQGAGPSQRKHMYVTVCSPCVQSHPTTERVRSHEAAVAAYTQVATRERARDRPLAESKVCLHRAGLVTVVIH